MRVMEETEARTLAGLHAYIRALATWREGERTTAEICSRRTACGMWGTRTCRRNGKLKTAGPVHKYHGKSEEWKYIHVRIPNELFENYAHANQVDDSPLFQPTRFCSRPNARRPEQHRLVYRHCYTPPTCPGTSHPEECNV